MIPPAAFEVAVVTPQVRAAMLSWLASRGWRLVPVPNGSDGDGIPVLDAPGQLPCFAVMSS